MSWVWNGQGVIELRNAAIPNPNAVDGSGNPIYQRVQIGVTWATPTLRRVGESFDYADETVQSTLVVGGVKFRTLPFSTLAQPAGSKYMDWGRYALLERILLGQGPIGGVAKYPHIYLMQTWDIGTDPMSGPIRRSGIHPTDAVGVNDFWNTYGLPKKINLPAERLNPQEQPGGLYSLEFTIEWARPE